ncbi:hypothetical protein SAMN05216344_10964 [Polaromonas sp. OV174]|uniref:hypothetical protein n=1 Tax=Polaromonas sp. OV174 TaxID=1855300 RepID=UPI0008E539D7|nr:hypothetical protein [Polaromonas sp. OV174]SFC11132.1 hypothetical protein SAMN05216344_10964 [Polaromonas sp. OV174]
MSNPFRSAQDILYASGRTHIYAIAIEASSRIFEEDRCPAPIQNWIEAHCPTGTEIERISELKDWIPVSALAAMPKTAFYVDLNDSQAEHFLQAFSAPPLDSLCAPNDIYLITLETSNRGLEDGIAN